MKEPVVIPGTPVTDVGVLVPYWRGNLLMTPYLSGALKDHWACPGGKAEKTDHTMLACALREAKEEAGIVHTRGYALEPLGNWHFESPSGRPCHCYFYLYHVPNDHRLVYTNGLEPTKLGDWVWVPRFAPLVLDHRFHPLYKPHVFPAIRKYLEELNA